MLSTLLPSAHRRTNCAWFRRRWARPVHQPLARHRQCAMRALERIHVQDFALSAVNHVQSWVRPGLTRRCLARTFLGPLLPVQAHRRGPLRGGCHA
jgi:hypothetical protein